VVSTGEGRFWNSSISLGVASPDESMYSMEDTLKKSDDSIYVAKHEGKNCVRYL
jgi:PleD family two-component response regulator